MKVLFVYKYLTLGGVEAVLGARLRGLGRRGIEAHAWFFNDFGGRSMFAGLADRIHVGDPGKCLRFARESGFDVLATIDSDELLAGFDGSPGPPRLVVECHSAYLENIEYLRTLGSRPPAAVFVPSEHHGEVVRERVGPGVEIRLVPNPLGQAFVAEPEPFVPPPPRPVVCWIGRLDEQKNWRLYLEIAGALVRRGAPAEHWLVGKAVEADGAAALLRDARELGALGRLRWLRGLLYGRMPALLDAVRDSGGAVLSTSRGESFGMTVVEAMARRCAVVLPDQRPFTELAQDGVSALLFRPGAAGPAADRVADLLADAELRAELGRRARETVLERFAPEPALAVLAAELRRLSP